MRVIANTRWTASRPRTSTSERSPALSRRAASATIRSPLESMNSSSRRSSTTRAIPSAAARRAISSSSGPAPERSSSPVSEISASPALVSAVVKARGATSPEA